MSEENHENPGQDRERPEDETSTLPVPPPNFKERLAAAQRARELQARRAMQFKTPPESHLTSKDTEPS